MRRKRGLRVATILAGLVMLALLGCGGNETGSGAGESGTGRLGPGDLLLPDGSYIDLRTYRAPEDGYFVIGMRRGGSNPVDDPFIFVFPGVVDTVAEIVQLINEENYLADDDSGLGRNALLAIEVRSGDTITVGFNTREANDTGTYAYTVEFVTWLELESLHTSREPDDKMDAAATAQKKAQSH